MTILTNSMFGLSSRSLHLTLHKPNPPPVVNSSPAFECRFPSPFDRDICLILPQLMWNRLCDIPQSSLFPLLCLDLNQRVDLRSRGRSNRRCTSSRSIFDSLSRIPSLLLLVTKIDSAFGQRESRLSVLRMTSYVSDNSCPISRSTYHFSHPIRLSILVISSAGSIFDPKRDIVSRYLVEYVNSYRH